MRYFRTMAIYCNTRPHVIIHIQNETLFQTMDEYVAELIERVSSLGMGSEDNSRVADAWANIDSRKSGSLDIDDLGRLLDAAGKPLPGFKIRQLLPMVKTQTPGQINVTEFAKVFFFYILKII